MSAIQALFEATRGPLQGYLRQMCGNDALAEDLLQETYIRLINHPPREADPAARRKWLFTTATRLLQDYWRRENPWRWWSFHREDGEVPWDPPSLECPVDEQLANLQLVERGLQALSPRQHSLLWLAHVEQLDHREIAACLGLRKGSVKVLLHRARTRMVETLKSLGLEGVIP